VALYKEMFAEKAKEAAAKSASLVGNKRAMTEEEHMQEVTVTKFPSLKGFFRQWLIFLLPSIVIASV